MIATTPVLTPIAIHFQLSPLVALLGDGFSVVDVLAGGKVG